MNWRLYLFPKASIGTYLIAMVTAIVVPIFAFVAMLLLQLEDNQRSILRQETAEDARALARTIDRQLQDITTTLRLLASAPELETGDLAGFHARTEAALAGSDQYVIAVDRTGQQIVNTRRPFGSPLPTLTNMNGFNNALSSGKIEISSAFVSKATGEWVYNVFMPVNRGQVAALVIAQSAAGLGRLVTTEGLAASWSAEVIDQEGKIIAANTESGVKAGTPVDSRIQPFLKGSSGIYENSEALPNMMLGYATISGSSWKAVVWGPVATAQASILTTWRFLIIGGALLLAVAFIGSYAVARQVRVTIRSIADMAQRMGSGEIVSPIETSVTEANQVAVALSNASFDRNQAEDRLHFIMHELIHRTKNLLTLAQAMMRQIARQSENVHDFEAAVTRRLDGLVRSIELLTSEQWTGASLRRVVDIHLAAFPHALEQIDIHGEDMMVKPEAVQNLGLALHELSTNSTKYGALSVPQGRIRFTWQPLQEGGIEKLRFVWEEVDGPLVKPPTRTGFGTTVIKLHASSTFGGYVDVLFKPEGLVWILTAPRSAFERAGSSELDAA